MGPQLPTPLSGGAEFSFSVSANTSQALQYARWSVGIGRLVDVTGVLPGTEVLVFRVSVGRTFSDLRRLGSGSLLAAATVLL